MELIDAPCEHDTTPPCTDSSYSQCPHCSQDLCLEHINEHQQLVRLDFNQVIDQINYERSIADDHNTANEMKAKALEQLHSWKTARIDLVTSVYDKERIRIEQTYDQCIATKTTLQNRIFEALNVHSNSIEKKKNIHPNDLLLLKQKLDELIQGIRDIEESSHTNFTDIVDHVELPQIIELKRQLETLPGLQNRVKQLQKDNQLKDARISHQVGEIARLRSSISLKDTQILAHEMEARAWRSDTPKRGQMNTIPALKLPTYGLR